jgi:hypothetical protein
MNWRREEGIELEKFVMNGNMDSKKRYHPESFPRGKRQFPRYEAYRKHQEKENHCEEFAFCGVSLRTLEKEQGAAREKGSRKGGRCTIKIIRAAHAIRSLEYIKQCVF